MRSIRAFTHVLPVLVCFLAPVAAQSDAPSLSDSLRSAWSSAVDFLKGAVDYVWSCVSDAWDSLRNALDDLRTSIANVIKPSKDVHEENVSGILSHGISTSAPSTATPRVQPKAYPTTKFVGTPSTRSSTSVTITTPTLTGRPPGVPARTPTPTLSGYVGQRLAVPSAKPVFSLAGSPTRKHSQTSSPADGLTSIDASDVKSTVTPTGALADNTTGSTTHEPPLVKAVRLTLCKNLELDTF